MKARIILENEEVFVGECIKEFSDDVCELVFNTSMTGYLSFLTDPAYAGQGIVMTYPLIGNYGISLEDTLSDEIWPSCFIVHELSQKDSNFRSTKDIITYLSENNVPTIYGLDTRSLTKTLRKNGAMKALITNNEYSNEESMLKIKQHKDINLVRSTSHKEIKYFGDKGASKKVAVLDLGSITNIVNQLLERNIFVTVFPHNTEPTELLNFDAIILSEGPGDPKDLNEVLINMKKVYESDVPVFGIGLGHEAMAIATGMDTTKLKNGHRGANLPIKDLRTGRVYITTQNHSYAVVESNMNPNIAVPMFVNINDNTIEGLTYVNKNIMTVQFGLNNDTEYILDEFLERMNNNA